MDKALQDAQQSRSQAEGGGRFDPKTLVAAANEIRTPLGIIALVVLSCAAFLGVQTLQGRPESGHIVTIGILVLLLVALIGGIVLALSASRPVGALSSQLTDMRAISLPTKETLRPFGKQKTFLSAPMASLHGEANYARMKQKMRAIKEALKRDAGQAEVFWGGDSIDDPTHFDRPAEALTMTIKLISDCDNFILVLPDYACTPHADGYCKPSSIWWEAGIAVAFGKRCTFFVHKQLNSVERMPYYMRAMQTCSGEGVPASKLWLFEDVLDVERDIRDSRENIFC